MVVGAFAFALFVASSTNSAASVRLTAGSAETNSLVRVGEGNAEAGPERVPLTIVAQASEQAGVEARTPVTPRISTLVIAGLAFAVALLLLLLFLTRRALRSKPTAEIPVVSDAMVGSDARDRNSHPPRRVTKLREEGSVATVGSDIPTDAAPQHLEVFPGEPYAPGRSRGETVMPVQVMQADTPMAVESVAERLISSGASRAIFVSPEGDEGAAVAVLVARELADAGLRVLLVDLTIAGAASIPMLESVSLAGLTDILVGKAELADIIHADNYSECQIIPVGTADPVRAMRSVDRLPIILDSLTAAYDIILLECGPTHAAGIRKLTNNATDILVSIIEPGSASVAATAASLRENGFDDVTLVMPSRRPARFRSG